MEYKINQVYFSYKKNRFIQVRGKHDDFYICGDFCNYYNDSMTNICPMQVSKEYLDSLVLSEVNCLDKVGYGVRHDGIGWRVRSKKGDF